MAPWGRMAPWVGLYSASKHALEAMAEALRFAETGRNPATGYTKLR